MKVVLDANLFVSAAIEPRGQPAQVLNAWRGGRFDVLTNEDMVTEIAEVLRRPRIRRRHGWTDEQIADFLNMLREVAVVMAGELALTIIAEDPDDDAYLACAVEGEADYIVSGDDHLRQLGSYRGIPILSARQFLVVLAE
jgi:uncharacterized protein